MTHTAHCLALNLLLCVSLASCGGRPAAGTDATFEPDRGSVRMDGQDRFDGPMTVDGPVWIGDHGTRRDACVRPAGLCHSDADCTKAGLKGYRCEGCYSDPCCPMCDVCVGRCGPNLCAQNSECRSGELCQHDYICVVTGAKAGTCEPRPQGCPMIYSPVCGCDGKTYGNSCEAHSAGVSVASAGSCDQKACQDLQNQYQTALVEAKKCCPSCKSIQCQTKVSNGLLCPCETYVQANSAALGTLSALQQKWNALGCSLDGACPPVACMPLKGSQCKATSSDGTDGLCEDVY